MKQFLCSIAIRPDLSKVDYFYPDDPAKTIVHSCFPAISMIANAGIKHGDELIVTPVVTNSSTSEANLNAFIAELTALEAKHNIKFTVEEPIRVELKETTAKHIAFFKSVSRSYKKVQNCTSTLHSVRRCRRSRYSSPSALRKATAAMLKNCYTAPI